MACCTGTSAQPQRDLVSRLVRRYFDRFERNVSPSPRARRIGLELEFPLVDSTGVPPGGDPIIALFEYRRCLFGWLPEFRSDVYWGISNPHAYEKVSFESGQACIEYSSPPCSDLFKLSDHVGNSLDLIIDFLGRRDVHLFGGGLSPVVYPTPKLSLDIDRYYFLMEETANRFLPDKVGKDFLLFMLSAQNSPHVDISREEAVDVFQVMNALSGLQIALTANSSMWNGQPDGRFKCLRNHFYEEMYPHRRAFLTMPSFGPRSEEEYISYVLKAPPFLVHRSGLCLRPLGFATLADYLHASSCKALDWHGKVHTITPEAEDIVSSERYLWTNARLRSSFGTIESRCSCQQPEGDIMCISALVLGIVSNLPKAKKLVASRPWATWQRIHTSAVKLGLAVGGENSEEYQLMRDMVAIAQGGLETRELGEEKFLVPLWRRLESKVCPADAMVRQFYHGGVQAVIERFKYRGHKRHAVNDIGHETGIRNGRSL